MELSCLWNHLNDYRKLGFYQPREQAGSDIADTGCTEHHIRRETGLIKSVKRITTLKWSWVHCKNAGQHMDINNRSALVI